MFGTLLKFCLPLSIAGTGIATALGVSSSTSTENNVSTSSPVTASSHQETQAQASLQPAGSHVPTLEASSGTEGHSVSGQEDRQELNTQFQTPPQEGLPKTSELEVPKITEEETEHRDSKGSTPAPEDIQLPEIGNCEFITFAKTSNIPEAFNVTEQDYFSVICKKEGESTILPEENWIGFFPKSFFSINYAQINEKSRVDIKVEDIPDEDPIYEQSEDYSEWYGIKISSPKLKDSQTIDTKLTYYSEDSSWAEVKPASLDEKIYLLLTQSDTGEEE